VTKPNHPPPWLFVLTGTSYGVVGMFVALVMPQLARDAKIDIGDIGFFGAMLFIPTVVQFLYAPIVDLGPRRKHWLVIVSVIGAGFLVATFLMRLPEHIYGFMFCAFMAQMISGLVGSCSGGLMAATMPDELRGTASGWYNVGNVSCGALSAALAIYMMEDGVAPLWIGLSEAAWMVLPAIGLLWIDEPARPQRPWREVFEETARDAWAVLRSRSGLTGIALCISPVGTAALANYFSGMNEPYRVSNKVVAIVNGLAAAGLSALGAYISGFLCDRYNRRAMYLIAGALTAVTGVVMVLSPRSAETYVVGVMVYALVTGFSYSAFTATVLETIGTDTQSASTKYSLFTAAGNAAIAYVGLIDTRFADSDTEGVVHNVNGVIWSDALLNIGGVVILGLVFWKLGSFGKWRHPKQEGET